MVPKHETKVRSLLLSQDDQSRSNQILLQWYSVSLEGLLRRSPPGSSALPSHSPCKLPSSGCYCLSRVFSATAMQKEVNSLPCEIFYLPVDCGALGTCKLFLRRTWSLALTTGLFVVDSRSLQSNLPLKNIYRYTKRHHQLNCDHLQSADWQPVHPWELCNFWSSLKLLLEA